MRSSSGPKRISNLAPANVRSNALRFSTRICPPKSVETRATARSGPRVRHGRVHHRLRRSARSKHTTAWSVFTRRGGVNVANPASWRTRSVRACHREAVPQLAAEGIARLLLHDPQWLSPSPSCTRCWILRDASAGPCTAISPPSRPSMPSFAPAHWCWLMPSTRRRKMESRPWICCAGTNPTSTLSHPRRSLPIAFARDTRSAGALVAIIQTPEPNSMASEQAVLLSSAAGMASAPTFRKSMRYVQSFAPYRHEPQDRRQRARDREIRPEVDPDQHSVCSYPVRMGACKRAACNQPKRQVIDHVISNTHDEGSDQRGGPSGEPLHPGEAACAAPMRQCFPLRSPARTAPLPAQAWSSLSREPKATDSAAV